MDTVEIKTVHPETATLTIRAVSVVGWRLHFRLLGRAPILRLSVCWVSEPDNQGNLTVGTLYAVGGDDGYGATATVEEFDGSRWIEMHTALAEPIMKAATVAIF